MFCTSCKNKKDNSLFYNNSFYATWKDNICKSCRNIKTKKYMKKYLSWTTKNYKNISTLWEDRHTEAELVLLVRDKIVSCWYKCRIWLSTSLWRPDIIIFDKNKPIKIIEVKKQKYTNKKFNDIQINKYKEFWEFEVLNWEVDVINFIKRDRII